MKHLYYLPLIVGMLLGWGCTQHHVTADTKHKIEVAPIHMTLDVNVKVQIDKQLDDAFAFEEEFDKTTGS